MKSTKSISMISAALAALLAGATLLPAQWPEHRTEGPRTDAGELDLKAPAPKLDGHPDLSGLWQPMRPNRANGNGRGRGGGAPAAPVRAPGELPAANFGDL